MKKQLLFALLMCCGAAAGAKEQPGWVVSWAASPMDMALPHRADDSTFENTVHLSLGDHSVRVTVTNEFGRTPLRVEHVHLRQPGQPSVDLPLTFHGNASVLIPAGGTATTDTIPMQVHLFPAWPKTWNARYTLRARGGFKVFASIRSGVIEEVPIESLAGSVCRMRNPCPGRDIRLIRNGHLSEALQGSIVTFSTSPSEKIQIAMK